MIDRLRGDHRHHAGIAADIAGSQRAAPTMRADPEDGGEDRQVWALESSVRSLLR